MFINFIKKVAVALFLLCIKVKKRYISICHIESKIHIEQNIYFVDTD